MNFTEFAALVRQDANPVILLEGTRALPDEFVAHLESLAAKLAREFPRAIFRSGNATGSDAAWARGVAKIDATRLELVVPYASHRRKERPEGARVLALEEIEDQRQLIRETLSASPQYQLLSNRKDQASKAKFSYLLRDTLKIFGVPQNGFAPITAGVFYVSEPNKGGTAHTMRVCQLRSVPIFTQEAWLDWLD